MDLSTLSDAELEALANSPESTAAPDVASMSDAELAAIAGKPVGKAQSFVAGAADAYGSGVIDELEAGLYAGVNYPIKKLAGQDVTLGGLYDAELAKTRQHLAQAAEQNPASYLAGSVTGAVAQGVSGAKLLAARAPKLTAKLAEAATKNALTKAATIGGVGALQGGAYGFGSGEGGIAERAAGAVIPAAIGGVGGAGASMFLGGLSRLIPKALTPNILASNADATIPAADNLPIEAVAGEVDAMGRVLPLSRGQLTQNQAAQSLEDLARSGAAGEGASQKIAAFDAKQQEALRNVFGQIQGSPVAGDVVEQSAIQGDALSRVASGLKSEYATKKSAVDAAYKAVGLSETPVRVAAQPVRDAFVPRVVGVLREFGLDADTMTPTTKKLIQKMDSIAKADKVTAIGLKDMEFWRRGISNQIANSTDAFGKVSPEGAALSKVLSEYDRFMAKLPEDALRGGSDETLDALNRARGLRREVGVLFERNKAINEIVKNNELTAEELANLVLTGSKGSDTLRAGSGRLVGAVKRIGGDAAVKDLKTGAVARALRRSFTPTIEAGTERNIISPAKLRNELSTILQNRTFVKEVFSPAELKVLTQVNDDLRKIGSQQKGTVNYSNTAYKIAELMRFMPFDAKAPFRAAGDVAASAQLSKDLAQYSDELQRLLAEMPRTSYATAGQALVNSPALQNTEEQY